MTTDRRVFAVLFFLCWGLYGAFEQPPFTLQGAMLEALVERGHLYIRDGEMRGWMLINRETRVRSFQTMVNMFPSGGVFRVNHTPGQFLFAAPWYFACTVAGLRFETNETLVWKILVWTLTAPLGALAAACLFHIGRRFDLPRPRAVAAAATFGLASPWWAASGVLYHDSIAIALIVFGVALALGGGRAAPGRTRSLLAGACFGWAAFTTYLVIPLAAALVALFVLGWRARRADAPGGSSLALAAAFVPFAALLPLSNYWMFGSLLSTGYSEAGAYENYPALEVWNFFEKIHFYLTHSDYGLFACFPIFAFAVVGVLPPLRPASSLWRPLGALTILHFVYICSMRHHGGVGWAMGRFFLPLYPMLALCLPTPAELTGRLHLLLRFTWFGAWFHSHAFAAAALGGLSGVMIRLPSQMSRLAQRPLLFVLPWLGAALATAALWFYSRRRAARGQTG